MRNTAPLMIILLAFLVYAGRDSLLRPLVNAPESPGDVMQTASVVPFEVPAPEPTMELERTAARTGTIGRNSSLYIELRAIDVSPVDIDLMVRAAKGTYNLKKVRAGQTFDVYLAPNGAVDSLVFHPGGEEDLKIRRSGDGFVATLEPIHFETTYHVTRGTIAHSIFASLKDHGAETELASAMDEIFGWTIDFISDIRVGDSYAILYERRSYEDGRTGLGDVLAARVVNQGTEHYGFRFDTENGFEGYFDMEGKSLQKSLRRSPLKFTRVTSNFSGRRYHPVYKTYRPHYGVDYGAPRGTPVYATGAGVVVAATRYRGNGNYVKIKHNGVYTTYYLHLNGFARGIRSGVRVRQGQLIGYVGSTGAANGPHVCYRIQRSGSWVNPRRLQLPSKEPVPPAQLADYRRVRDALLSSLRDAILDGDREGPAVVERPAAPADDQMQTLF